MEMTFHLPDEMSLQLRQLPNPDQFVQEVLQIALNDPGRRNSTLPYQSSKWEKLVKRIHEEPRGLRGYSAQLQHDMQEFRDNFAFTQEEDNDVSS
ncbi:conserved hypothetical protein [Candidatus Magnetomoraceae bacterium gMMP-15]